MPILAEECGPAIVQTSDTSTPHALMLEPEGSGRTTLLAALHLFFDRGATSLVQEIAIQFSRTLSRREMRQLPGVTSV